MAFWLQKKITTYFLDSDDRRVPKGTAGARKVRTESEKWYGCWREGTHKKMVPLAADKQAAQAMLADLMRQRERGQAGLIDPYKPHLDRNIGVHLEDYLRVLRGRTRSDQHHTEVERVLTQMFAQSRIVVLRDLTADRVQQHLASLTCGATTKNKKRTYVVSFCNFLWGSNRLPSNPITRFSVQRAKAKETEVKRVRRGLKLSEIRCLLEAAEKYPLVSSQTNKGGRGAKKKPQVRPAKLKPKTVEMLQRRGRERRLLYRIALLTGLRRKEIERLRVQHLELDRTPFARIALPGNLTKNNKPANIPLLPSLVDELCAWITETNRGPGDKLLYVPSRSNMSKIHKANLALAGIPYKDDHGRYADFHALRKCANVILRKAGVPAKERQLFLRHSKLELTTETYDDDQMTSTKRVLRVLRRTKL